ncbi:NAD(P)/FAD-dependent oxidoreductase [Brevibacillus dissolubilis]|uniref:NAD(P)/FAD-dependent oxidoreductase n=1 Tax=Brevibacillus dissolubilis TaxID=1844116 RepID=UPI001117A6D3|nr:NAD(P)/FAD-dependent oxidoreductase [Brevibacillus dissolubilis]
MVYDTIIVGGGIAGLQAAIQLGRSLRRVLVIDNHNGRSSIAKDYRNILGFRDGVSGDALRESGYEQARMFGVQFLEGEATFCEQEEGGLFCVTLRDQKEHYQAHTLVVATGISDKIPEIPGIMPCLGESIYICPDCDGYEVRNKKTVIIGSGQQGLAMAKRVRYFTDEIVIINHDRSLLEPDEAAEIKESGFAYYEEPITSLQQEAGRLQSVTLQSGTKIDAANGFVAFQGGYVNSEILKNFSVDLLPNGHVIVDPRTKETSHRNLWAVGDLAAHSQMVTIAMGDGSQAAIWIHKRLFELGQDEAKMSKVEEPVNACV